MSDTPYFNVTVSNWSEAKEAFAQLRGFYFRGQVNADWPLTTSLERAAKRAGLGPKALLQAESIIVRTFRRRAHHFVPSPPAADEEIEWLALIQHHGGPTRLLDFTHSAYVAAFFAMETADQPAAVWAINGFALRRRISETFLTDFLKDHLNLNLEHVSIAQEILRGKREAVGTLWLEPDRLNERMAVQQGIFLFTCDLRRSFEENLLTIFGIPVDILNSTAPMSIKDIPTFLSNADIVKIQLPRQLHPEGLLDLEQMNVSAASLFPGLDGFTRSLSGILRRYDAVTQLRRSTLGPDAVVFT